jgi:hypothetical protein
MPHASWGKVLVAAGALACCSLGRARDARATLGGDAASIAVNQQRLAATRRMQKIASGERHDLDLASGTVVHEYVSPAGLVYAIAWSGPRMPDLRELLGGYFAQLSSRAPRGGHHRMALVGSDLVVRSSAHRHTFAGRAWVPSLVPPGVRPGAGLE